MSRIDNVSANAGRIFAASVARHCIRWGVVEDAVMAATLIEDAVEAAERARKGLPQKNEVDDGA